MIGNSNKRNPTILRQVVRVALGISSLLSLIVSSSFIANRLSGDEEWMVFWEYAGFRLDFWQGLMNVGSYALAEVYVYARLRFAYPFTEIVGGSATNFIESILGTDPMLAYGVWRVLVVMAIGAMFIGLVYVLTFRASYPIRALAVFLSAFAIPATALAPDAITGFRLFPSHYGLMALLGIIFVAAAWWLLDEHSSVNTAKMRRLTLASLVLIGPLMVVSSEFFYALGPAIVAGRLVQIFVVGPAGSEKLKSELKSTFIFAGGFVVSLLTVRIILAYFCAQSSFCYSRTKVTLGLDSLVDGSFVFVGRLPFVTQMAGVYRDEVEMTSLLVPFVILATIGLAFVWFLKRFRNDYVQELIDSKEAMRIGLVLLSMGIGWSFSTAFAVSSTESFVRGPLGSASSEAIQLAIGSSLILVGAGLILIHFGLKLRRHLLGEKRVSTYVPATIVTVALSFLVVGSWAVNTSSAANDSDAEDIMLQRELSLRVVTPNVVGNEVTDRCEVIVRKMLTFPRAQNHEDTVLLGLNLRYRDKFGMDFCSFDTLNEAREASGLT